MANALADPVLLFFIAGLFGSGFLLTNGRGKNGLEGTNRMLDGSLAFATTGLLGSAWTWVIYNDMVRNPLVGNFVRRKDLFNVVL